jgi:hypothetical protein
MGFSHSLGQKQTSTEIYFDQPSIHVIPIQRSAQRCTFGNRCGDEPVHSIDKAVSCPRLRPGLNSDRQFQNFDE